MILHDQHMHSHYSEDSKEELKNYLDLAVKVKCSYFMTCEHVDFDPPSFEYSWIADFKALKEECKSLIPLYPNINFLYGIELGYRADHLDDMQKMLNDNTFDLVQLSVHDDSINDYYLKESFMDTYNDLNKYFDKIYEAICTFSDYDVLSHFDYGFKTARIVNPDEDIKLYEDKLKKIFNKLIELDKPLEINAKVQSTINDDNYLYYILNLYYSLGGRKLTLSSDAHKAQFYRYNFDKYMKMIKDAGFKYLCYFIKREQHYYDL